ncbi:P-loop containing nucleoside triphosphate hydrolase protein [Chaetomium strumarium]|uniref:P-loop containing nucleoside triphosphate hydrolase protein n=1 Tax=Chaetomium strumarium TaxID=1170767 RepID=A0AAJ0M3H5_9PEZI|nr:P-loop containing nucleoside triphosphate hydrolase protein [Chaetomium strumarium]
MASTPDGVPQTRMVDDKSPICIPFLLERLAQYREQSAGKNDARPFIVGINGVQGVGKTTLVRALAQTLQEREGLPTLVVSIDDFYLTHADQLALAAAHPDNALVQYRGEPGTHDLPLVRAFLASLTANKPTPVPQYDKSAFSGLGDRQPPSSWPTATSPQVLILEGWCVGFRPLDNSTLEGKWRGPSRTLHNHKLEHLQFINSQLAEYDAVINRTLNAFIHIDAEDIEYVYAWRAEQEEQLRREKGAGMTGEQVVKFVDAYYPAYELFTEGVREGIFLPARGCQLRVVVGRDRRVKESVVI